MNVEIANRLQMLRKKNGYSQEELAEKIGISRQAVSKWERAEASPDTDNLILLAKLYGVTIDELLSTDNATPNSEGISLRKEDYEYNASADDDGEIYPGRKNASQSAENRSYSETSSNGEARGYYDAGSASSGEKTETAGSGDPAEFIRTTADFAVNVAKEAIGTAARAISEADERIKSGENRERSVGESFERNFEGFGEKVETFGDEFAQKMESFGKKVEQRFENLEKTTESKFDTYAEKQRAEQSAKKPKSREKFAPTLLDKLFPLIIVCIFLFAASIRMADIAWLLFFTIPVYYIFSDAVKRCKAGKLTPFQALVRFVDCALPVGVTFLFLFFGIITHWWDILWTMFFIIPLYYTAKAAVKRRNLLIFCYPAAAVWAFFGMGLLFGAWDLGLVCLATIPFYYIIVDHYRRKSR